MSLVIQSRDAFEDSRVEWGRVGHSKLGERGVS